MFSTVFHSLLIRKMLLYTLHATYRFAAKQWAVKYNRSYMLSHHWPSFGCSYLFHYGLVTTADILLITLISANYGPPTHFSSARSPWKLTSDLRDVSLYLFLFFPRKILLFNNSCFKDTLNTLNTLNTSLHLHLLPRWPPATDLAASYFLAPPHHHYHYRPPNYHLHLHYLDHLDCPMTNGLSTRLTLDNLRWNSNITTTIIITIITILITTVKISGLRGWRVIIGLQVDADDITREGIE